MIRILVVDDHVQIRNMIRRLVEERSGWKVVAEGSDGYEAVQHTKRISLTSNIQMPKMDGFEATRQILKTFPRMLILIISIHDGSYFAEVSRSLGAKGFLPKLHLPDKLVPAIESILQGGSHFPVDAATA